MVRCDKNRLNRVLLNLISNAYKFTQDGGNVSVVLKQDGEALEGKGRYELRVKDSGIGMTEEFAEKVFDAFERERTSTVSGNQGTGLGMAITKSIIDLMGGTIEVETAPEQGTEFIINLAFDIQDEADDYQESTEGEQEKTDEQEDSSDFGGMRIIAMTANAFSEDVKKAHDVGMNGHIAKSIDINDMVNTLKEVLKSL